MPLRTILFSALFCLCLWSPSLANPKPQLEADNEAAIAAYRSGQYETAAGHWRKLLEEPRPASQRAGLCYNLGNAAWRRGERMEAVGWYTAAIRLSPRHADAHANLEYARREAALDPADGGDLSATLKRLLWSVDEAESQWLVLFGLGVFGLALLGEALRGGRFWVRLSVLGFCFAALCSAPLVWQTVHTDADPMLIVAHPSVAMRAEPAEEHTPIAQLSAGVQVERVDELGQWVKVETDNGQRGWLPKEAAFDLTH